MALLSNKQTQETYEMNNVQTGKIKQALNVYTNAVARCAILTERACSDVERAELKAELKTEFNNAIVAIAQALK